MPGEIVADARAALASLHSAEDRRDNYRRLLRLILAYEASIFVHWSETAEELPCFIDRTTHCFGCGAAGRLFAHRSSLFTRWTARCTQCNSFYADTPAGSELIDCSFSITPQRTIEHAIPSLPNQAIALNLRTSLEHRTTWFWGEPYDLLGLPPGRSWLWLYSLSDHGLHAYSRLLDNRAGSYGAKP
jgi:hypothetical protein